MRWTLALSLILSLALIACGGDGDSDDNDTDDTTPVAVAPTATSRPTAPPSPTAAPTTPAATAVAEASRQPDSGGGVQRGETPDPAGATPTRRPATVVTTPRPIARTPTPRPVFEQPTAAPTESSDGEVVILIDETFDDPATTPFFTGETDYGVIAGVDAGWYGLQVPEGTWQNLTLSELDDLADGAILVDLTIQGEGAGGVVARSVSAGELWTFYVCWLSSDGSAGCHVSIDSDWQELFRVDPGVIPLQEVNALFLSVDGPTLYFDVNDVEVGLIDDFAATTGVWGVFAESYAGTTTIWFDRVTLAAYP